jgi:hypothetical protein
MGVAFLALAVALGGTSWAVTQIDPRSVGTAQLKRGAVAGPNIKANAVTGRRVANNSLSGADINESTLESVPLAARASVADSAAVANTAAAATRAAAADLADRATVAAGLDRIVFKTQNGSVPAAPSIDEPSSATAIARCDSGQLVTGGGVRTDEGVRLSQSYPDGAGAWNARVENDDNQAGKSFVVFAICVPASAIG